jgi:uncharacterized membrane protein YfcA
LDANLRRGRLARRACACHTAAVSLEPILLIGAFLAAVLSGATGFGGALLLLPLLTHVLGPALAVPLLTVSQLLGNLARAGLGWREIRWRPVGLFLITSVPAAALGALSFVALPKGAATRVLAAGILAFLALRWLSVKALRPSRSLLLGGGAVVGALSGLIGTAGPFGAAVFLSLELPPQAYVASEAVTAAAMHGVKSVVYGSALDPGPSFWPLAAALGLATIAGTWVGRRVISHAPPRPFAIVVSLLLAGVAVEMLVAG